MHYFTPTCCVMMTTVAALSKGKPQAGQLQMSAHLDPVVLVSVHGDTADVPSSWHHFGVRAIVSRTEGNSSL